MTAASFVADLKGGSVRKNDPEPGESVQPSVLQTLIRRLRWTILGLEYHVRFLYPTDYMAGHALADSLPYPHCSGAPSRTSGTDHPCPCRH